ncbi:MAG TPA: transglutaminase domain-containing protein [Opitutaceae bacterium]|nr:transglutaminase domain-containing protein [Opitutaceae bacterium]
MSSIPTIAPKRVRLTAIFRHLLCATLIATGPTLLRGSVGADEPASPPAAPTYSLPDDPREMLQLTPEMLAFFDARVHRHASLETRLDEISDAILGERGLHFRYVADGVWDVRETFRRRAGNCVAYSMLIVAVARAYGIPAKFNEVQIDPRWSRLGSIVLESRHLNVRVESGDGGYELDLIMPDDLRTSRRSSTVVSDERAWASAYTNAGVYRLAAGDRRGAFTLLERAVAIDPTFGGAWTNLGCAHLLSGERELASLCFKRALANDPRTMSALSGLARLERRAGRIAEAERLERRVRNYRERNPYYLLAVARDELESGRPEAARRYLARAIWLKRDEPEFYETMIEVSRQLGAEREANRWARRLNDARDAIAAVAR